MDRFKAWEAAEVFLLVAVLNIIAFLGTAALHELGHAALGIASGCTDIGIVFDLGTGAVYTGMRCPVPPSPAAMFASSYLFTGPLALLLLALHDIPERHIGLVVLGANMAGSVTDIAAFAGSPVSVTLLVAGIVLIILGEDRLVRSLVARQTPGATLYGNRYKDRAGSEEQDDGSDRDISADGAGLGGDADRDAAAGDADD